MLLPLVNGGSVQRGLSCAAGVVHLHQRCQAQDKRYSLYRIDVQLDIQSFLAPGESMPLQAGLKVVADVLLERRKISNNPSCSTRRRGYCGGAGIGSNVSRSGAGSCHFGSGAGSNANYIFTTSGLGGRHVCASRAPKFRCWLIKSSMIS